MKKSIKIVSLFIIVLLFTCACFDDDIDPIEEVPVKEEDKRINNIITYDVALFNGEYGDRTIVLKAQNNNSEPVYLHYSIDVFNENKTKLYNKEVYVRVGSNDYAYVIGIQDMEEDPFDTYSYKVRVLDDKLEEYDSIKRKIRIEKNDNGKEIVASIGNTGTRTTTVYGWLFFYKNKELVAVKEVTSFNLTPNRKDIIKVKYPVKKGNKIISFDNVEFIVNEVSTEL